MTSIQQLTAEHSDALRALWGTASDVRRAGLGLRALDPDGPAGARLDRPGSFGVGDFDGTQMRSVGVALPALTDDGRGSAQVPGLVHVSSVATDPAHWGKGHGQRVVRALLLQAARRGFGRAQLWTQVSSPGAQHLYEKMGFLRTGRVKVDENGEEILHYMCHVLVPVDAPRRAARVVCLDPDDRVLLLRWRDPVDGHVLWEPPGGGIEADESPREAAAREWIEETGIPVPELANEPVTVARDVVWNGSRAIGDELFFLGRAQSAAAPDTSGQTALEATCYLGHAWVGWQELERLADTVEPHLTPVLQRMHPAGPWADA